MYHVLMHMFFSKACQIQNHSKVFISVLTIFELRKNQFFSKCQFFYHSIFEMIIFWIILFLLFNNYILYVCTVYIKAADSYYKYNYKTCYIL